MTPDTDVVATMLRPEPARKWWTMEQLSERVDRVVGPRTLRRAAATGRLKSIVINGRGTRVSTIEWFDEFWLGLQKD